jgi:TM2 domain-containing membrane protein YozV
MRAIAAARQESHVTNPNPFLSWSDQQRATFYYQMAAVQKDEVLGVLLAAFLGSFGLHHFYLKQNGLGILYLLLFWTGIPGFLGLIEAFFMPGRVRRFNAEQAAYIAASLGPAQGGASSGSSIAVTCPACSTVIAPGAKFCSSCGTPSAK